MRHLLRETGERGADQRHAICVLDDVVSVSETVYNVCATWMMLLSQVVTVC
eukprot:m.1647073 g.1647073  ORF g.1647073 m.1647073 type:complete len:51 (+) comp73991_c0_seq1:403-555(+)